MWEEERMSASMGTSILAEANVELLALLLVVLAVMASALFRTLKGRSSASDTQGPPRGAAAPTPFSYWYALVPFEHDAGAKERPVLVLRLEGTNARVLKVTSKANAGRTNWRPVDTSRWDRPGQREGSWLQTDKVTTVPLAGFRRCLGHEDNVYFRRELLRIHATEFGQPRANPPGRLQS
jgi:hypothetical protein